MAVVLMRQALGQRHAVGFAHQPLGREIGVPAVREHVGGESQDQLRRARLRAPAGRRGRSPLLRSASSGRAVIIIRLAAGMPMRRGRRCVMPQAPTSPHLPWVSAKSCGRVGEDEIAGERQFESAGVAHAVDCGDHRLGQQSQPLDHARLERRRHRRLAHGVQVGARAEAAARAAQQRRSRCGPSRPRARPDARRAPRTPAYPAR